MNETTIEIYGRNLTINQLADILPRVEADMIEDLVNSIYSKNSQEEQIEILTTLYRLLPNDANLRMLLDNLGVSVESIAELINQNNYNKKQKKRKPIEDEVPVTTPLTPNYENITTSKTEYKTNREIRTLTPITDVPDVNFDMPTVPDLPTLL